MRRPYNLLLVALIAVGTLAGLFGAYRRWQAEELNKRVELTLDYTEVRNLAVSTGRSLPEVLARFKAAGITSVAVTEDTLAGLETEGELHVDRRGELTTVTVNRPELLSRIQHTFAARGLVRPIAPGAPTTGIYFPPQVPASPGFGVAGADYSAIRPLGIGLDPEAVNTVRSAGLAVVGRIGNFPGVSLATMEGTLADLRDQRIRTVVFQGLEVLGFRGQEKLAAEAFEQTGLQFGQIEFGKQKGDEKLGIALRGDYVRVHSIGDAEMGTMDEPEMIERFVRAARERNIRLCYIHLETLAGEDPVGTNVEYLGKIARGIARGHEMAFGEARPFGETAVPSPLFPLIGLGAGAGVVLLITLLVPLSNRTTIVLGIGVALVCALLAMYGEMGRKLVALLAALAFPTIACLRRDLLGETGDTDSRIHATGGEAIRRALAGLGVASLVTALGIAQVVGLLATRPFMVKANQFLGIKAAHAVPILIIGLLAITTLPALGRPWGAEWARIKGRMADFLREPTRIGPLLLTLVALAALALIVARTGNDPGVGVSGFELKARSLLDKLLPVRPRTKEFLVGHPAFVFALALWFRGRRKWALPLFVVGVVGQVSLLNTFCHIHTPLRLSFMRDVIGLVLGAAIGVALFWLSERWAALTTAPARREPVAEPARSR